MSQNPYATYGNTTDLAPQGRTSVLAILSLVSSLICCIPGLSVIGTLLGAVAVLRISSSNGRRTGLGLAIAGIIIGLLISLCYIGAYATMATAIKQMTGVGSAMVNNLQATDASELRKKLPAEQAALLTDAQWKSFRDQIDAEIGTPEELPGNPISYFVQVIDAFSKYGKASGNSNRQQNMSSNLPPIPLKGSKGVGVMMVDLNGEPSPDTDRNLSILRQVTIFTGSGKTIQLFPTTSPALPSPPPTPLPPAPPSDGTAPKPNGV